MGFLYTEYLSLNSTFPFLMSARQGILTVKVEKYQSVVGRPALPFFPSLSRYFFISLDFLYTVQPVNFEVGNEESETFLLTTNSVEEKLKILVA